MAENSCDVVIVGAGFAGLYMLHKVRSLGLSARVFEAGSGVGGTWYWNRYPGARVDMESQEYSFSFSPELEEEWKWSERYSAQPELLRYINHVADRFDLRRDIQFETRVTAATFLEAEGRWRVSTDQGDVLSARYCVMSTGCLSVPKEADFPGLETFSGQSYHTGRWPHEGVDFRGRTVGVIGTGSSAVQAIPLIAEEADHVFVFQRTPNYSVPAHNGPMSEAVRSDWLANREDYRLRQRAMYGAFLSLDPSDAMTGDVSDAERRRIYEERWRRGGFAMLGAFADVILDPAANAVIAEFMAEKVRTIVKDPHTAELLTTRDYPFGAKRLCVDTDYYATFNRDNVTLVDVRAAPIETITPEGVKTADGEYAVDTLVTAIGFDALTGALAAIDVRGRGGLPLRDAWAEGPKTYLGLMVAGFPNLFIVAGPGSPSVLSNMVISIEQHVEWIAECLDWLGGRQLGLIEATTAAQDEWVAHVNEVAAATILTLANSWYVGANIPGKPRVFMPYAGGAGPYREKCDAVAAAGYEGFSSSRAPSIS